MQSKSLVKHYLLLTLTSKPGQTSWILFPFSKSTTDSLRRGGGQWLGIRTGFRRALVWVSLDVKGNELILKWSTSICPVVLGEATFAGARRQVPSHLQTLGLEGRHFAYTYTLVFITLLTISQVAAGPAPILTTNWHARADPRAQDDVQAEGRSRDTGRPPSAFTWESLQTRRRTIARHFSQGWTPVMPLNGIILLGILVVIDYGPCEVSKMGVEGGRTLQNSTKVKVPNR